MAQAAHPSTWPLEPACGWGEVGCGTERGAAGTDPETQLLPASWTTAGLAQPRPPGRPPSVCVRVCVHARPLSWAPGQLCPPQPSKPLERFPQVISTRLFTRFFSSPSEIQQTLFQTLFPAEAFPTTYDSDICVGPEALCPGGFAAARHISYLGADAAVEASGFVRAPVASSRVLQSPSVPASKEPSVNISCWPQGPCRVLGCRGDQGRPHHTLTELLVWRGHRQQNAETN